MATEIFMKPFYRQPVSGERGGADLEAIYHLYLILKIMLQKLCRNYNCRTVPWLRRLVAGFSPRRPGFDPVSVHVGFVVDKVALGRVFLRVFLPVNFIPPVFH